MARSVISDLGGIFIRLSFGLAFQEWARRSGRDAEDIRQRFVFDQEFADFEVNRLTPEQYFDHLRRTLGLPLGDRDIAGGWNSIFIGIDGDVRSFFANLRARGTRVIGVTNTNITHQGFWSQAYRDDLGVFDAVYTSVDVCARKPEKEMFDHILRDQGLRSEEVVFFDDLAENVEPVREYGIEGYVFTDLACMIDDLVQSQVLPRDWRREHAPGRGAG